MHQFDVRHADDAGRLPCQREHLLGCIDSDDAQYAHFGHRSQIVTRTTPHIEHAGGTRRLNMLQGREISPCNIRAEVPVQPTTECRLSSRIVETVKFAGVAVEVFAQLAILWPHHAIRTATIVVVGSFM